MYKTILLVFLVSVASWALIMALFSLLARRPAGRGVRDGRLAPCPGTPNCVCSQDDDRHAVEPLHFDGPPEEAPDRGGRHSLARPTCQEVPLSNSRRPRSIPNLRPGQSCAIALSSAA